MQVRVEDVTVNKPVTLTETESVAIVTLSLSEARELQALIGRTSQYERCQLFEGAKTSYPSRHGGNDIFGCLFEALDAARL